MSDVRLQKFLAECGVGSRRKMEQFITEGRVRVNGAVVTELGRKIDPYNDRIEVNRKLVRAAPKGIMLLNKPRGVVSTMSDPEGRRTVADFLTKQYQSYFPVGRLDWDSTGLMVLTNDGEIAERLMHPRYGFERVYHARVEGSVSSELLGKLERGIRLSDGVVRASAAILKNDENTTWLEVRINEGRNRVVRRLFDKLGHSVMKLKRIVYGPFRLGRLQVGQIRPLSQDEYENARRKVMATNLPASTKLPAAQVADGKSSDKSSDRSGDKIAGVKPVAVGPKSVVAKRVAGAARGERRDEKPKKRVGGKTQNSSTTTRSAGRKSEHKSDRNPDRSSGSRPRKRTRMR